MLFHFPIITLLLSPFQLSSSHPPEHRPASCIFFLLSARVAFLLSLFSYFQSNSTASERALLNIWLRSTDFPSTSSIFRRPSNNSSILQPPPNGTLPHNHKSLSNFNPLTAAFITLMAQPGQFSMCAIAKVKTTAQRGGRWLKRRLNACRGSQASTNTRNLSIVGQT
jgi:hypothetical protein